MKYLLILLALGLTGCDRTPHFKVGDCLEFLAPRTHEKWEYIGPSNFIYRILEVGKQAYRVDHAIHYKTGWKYTDATFPTLGFSSEEFYTKVACPCEGTSCSR